MAKRSSPLEDLIDTLLDAASFDWPLGVLLTGLSFFASLASLDWAVTRYLEHLPSSRSFIEGFAEHLGWVYFGLPILLLSVSLLFGIAALRTYQRRRQNNQDRF